MLKPRIRPILYAAAMMVAIGSFYFAQSIRTARAAATTPGVGPADALRMLLDGNQRFADGKPLHPNQDVARRGVLAGGQQPFAGILSCSDSRTAPEIIFDRGLGDLFIVRDAGNVAGSLAMESLYYTTAHLGTRLIVVLGHSKCGAVAATQSGHGSEIPDTAKLIDPAVAKAKGMPGDPLDNAIAENVRLNVKALSEWEPLAKMVQSGQIQIVGAVYNLDTGKVTLLDQPRRLALVPGEVTH